MDRKVRFVGLLARYMMRRTNAKKNSGAVLLTAKNPEEFPIRDFAPDEFNKLHRFLRHRITDGRPQGYDKIVKPHLLQMVSVNRFDPDIETGPERWEVMGVWLTEKETQELTRIVKLIVKYIGLDSLPGSYDGTSPVGRIVRRMISDMREFFDCSVMIDQTGKKTIFREEEANLDPENIDQLKGATLCIVVKDVFDSLNLWLENKSIQLEQRNPEEV